MFAQMGNDERQNAAQIPSLPNSSVFVTTPKVGGTGRNLQQQTMRYNSEVLGINEQCQAFARVASAKTFPSGDWLRQVDALRQSVKTPRWRITPRPASIPRVELHIALRSPFLLALSASTLNNTLACGNSDHTSESVHCVHACIGLQCTRIHAIARIHEISQRASQTKVGNIECVFSLYDKMR